MAGSATGATTEPAGSRARPDLGPEDLYALIASTREEEPGLEPRLLVLDDAHLLSRASTQLLDQLVNDDPDRMRVLLLTRWDLRFTRLAPELLGDLTMLRGDLLRLDEHESAALVAAHAATDSRGGRAIARAHPGLVRRRRAHRPRGRRGAGPGGPPNAEVRPAVADRGRQRGVRHPAARGSGTCCSASPANPSSSRRPGRAPVPRPGAGAILADLEATGLLVSRCAVHDDDPGSGERYTIHPLLTEVVRRRLAAGGVDVHARRGTVQRAVRLDVGRGQTEDALDRLDAVGDYAVAAALLADEGPTLLLAATAARLAPVRRRHPSAIEVNPGVVRRGPRALVDRRRHGAPAGSTGSCTSRARHRADVVQQAPAPG